MVVIFPIAKLVRDIGPRILRWCQSQKHVGFQQLYRFYFMSIFLQACLFMVFSITSALFGGVILLFYSKEIASASCRRYYNNYHYYNNYYYGYGHGKSTLPKRYPSYSYDAKMGLAALILTVGIIEFVTGFWLSVCLWVMIPCRTADSEVRFSYHRFRVQD